MSNEMDLFLSPWQVFEKIRDEESNRLKKSKPLKNLIISPVISPVG
jgi:hypothetical protein